MTNSFPKKKRLQSAPKPADVIPNLDKLPQQDADVMTPVLREAAREYLMEIYPPLGIKDSDTIVFKAPKGTKAKVKMMQIAGEHRYLGELFLEMIKLYEKKNSSP